MTANRATTYGGAILAVSSAVVNVENSTLAENTADWDNDGFGGGGGVAIYGSMTMTNTILAENYDKGNEDPDCYGPISSGDYNLLGIGDSPGCTFSAQTHDLVGTTASPLDPQLGIFGDHGGPTETMPIKVSGPAGDQIPAGVNGCVAGTRTSVVLCASHRVILVPMKSTNRACLYTYGFDGLRFME